MNQKNSMSLAYISYNLPALTTTFIYREVLELEKRGVQIQLVSLKRPAMNQVSHEVRRLVPEVIYLRPVPVFQLLFSQCAVLIRSPLKYVNTLLFALTRRTSSLGKKFRLLYHFFISSYLSRNPLMRGIDHIHAHFASGPASVALFTAELLNKTFSFTAHAIDIYVDDIDIGSKIRKSAFVNVISNYNREYLKGFLDEADHEKLKVIYCGIDAESILPRRAASPSSKKNLILSVGRLVEKKGHRYLIEASKILVERGYEFSCEIIGSGPLEGSLRSMVNDKNLENRVVIPGAVFQEEVQEKLRETDIFVLPCVIASNGDRDVIPTVLVEAMAMRVPVISCDVAAIGELITDGVNGFLVPEKDPERLAEAMIKMLDNPALRVEMGTKGRQTVMERFDVVKNSDDLLGLFERVVQGTT